MKNKRITENYEVGAPFCPKSSPVTAGEFSVTPQRVKCDEPYILRISYKVGNSGIACGGGLQILFQGAQSENINGKCFISVSSSNQAARFKFVHKTYPRVFITTPETLRPNVNWHAAVLSGADLKSGDLIEISIGIDTNPLTGPIKRNKFKDASRLLQHYIDTDGSGIYVRLANSPSIEILPKPGTRLHAFLPSIVKQGEKTPIRAAVTDEYGNYIETPSDTEIGIADVWSRRFFIPSAEGIMRASGRTGNRSLQTKLNPVTTVRNNGLKLFWGDIHFHSNLSNDVMLQGIENSPEDCLLYGREVSGLDFACLTDHYEPVLKTWQPMLDLGIGLSEELWRHSKGISEKFNCPGSFATFFGYEYRTQRGDTNIYFRDCDAAPLLPGQCDSMSRIREYCANLEFFSAPHLHPYSHQYLTLGPWKWGKEVIEQWQDIGGDSEPIIEVFSRHGRYEFYGNQPHMSLKRGMTEGNSVQAHLLRGHCFGIYAGSDDHWGRPGQDGLTAVFAAELTREAIFDALRKRRCYGTTNARIILGL